MQKGTLDCLLGRTGYTSAIFVPPLVVCDPVNLQRFQNFLQGLWELLPLFVLLYVGFVGQIPRMVVPVH